MLRAITFDFWNTLYIDVNGSTREARRRSILRDMLARQGLEPPDSAIDEALQAGYDAFDRVWVAEYRTPLCDETVGTILAALGATLPPDARAAVTQAFEQMLLDLPPEPMPGAIGTIPRLAERYRLAVICDTGYSPGSVLRELLARDGLLEYFRYLYFSNEHGISKPDVRAFRHTLAELDVRAPEAAHVGDIQRTDIAGAQAAGMAAVHFIAANSHDAPHSTGDLLVRHFDELPAALGGLTCAGC